MNCTGISYNIFHIINDIVIYHYTCHRRPLRQFKLLGANIQKNEKYLSDYKE